MNRSLNNVISLTVSSPGKRAAVEAQAIDRAHRIGQGKLVFIYKLVTANSVEEKMLAMQEKKRALAVTTAKGTDRMGA